MDGRGPIVVGPGQDGWYRSEEGPVRLGTWEGYRWYRYNSGTRQVDRDVRSLIVVGPDRSRWMVQVLGGTSQVGRDGNYVHGQTRQGLCARCCEKQYSVSNA